MALRQASGFGESLLRPVGPDWAVSDFRTLSRRQKSLAVAIPDRGSEGPLFLPIDCTASERDGEWHVRMHGGPKRRVWRKIPLGIDAEPLEIRAVEIAGSQIGDAPVLPDLPSRIPMGGRRWTVTAGGAYDTRSCHGAIAGRGAQGVIRPRKNAKPWNTVTAGALARNGALRVATYRGRTLRRRWRGYHRRSRIETKVVV